jgi:F-type H+-transporting ATPase subunit delta
MKITRKVQFLAKQLYRNCVVEGRLDESRVRATVSEMVSRKPRGYLAILTRFERLVRLEIQRRQALVQSAVPLSPALQAAVRENLTRLYGPGLDVTVGQDSGLIGGLRVQVGDDLYDGTIRSRLDRLEEGF